VKTTHKPLAGFGMRVPWKETTRPLGHALASYNLSAFGYSF
jgi:hypothetical protein